MSARLSCLIAFGVATTVAWPARAGDPVAAESLFKQALALLEQDKWSEACPKFQASFDLDPSVGTLINLARCSEHDGKVATAWGQLADAARRNLDSPPGPRKDQLSKYIAQKSDELSARFPRVRFNVSGAPKNELSLMRDGAPLPSSALGQLLPGDPGEHVFTARAPGFRVEEKRFTLVEKQELDVTVELVKEAAGDAPPIAPPPSFRAGPRAQEPDAGAGGQSVAGYTFMGVGGASVIAGAILGGIAGLKAGEVPETCTQDPFTCPAESDTIVANEASGTGSALLIASGVTLSAGAALFVTGVILWATDGDSPPSAAFAPWFGPSAGGGGMSVRW